VLPQLLADTRKLLAEAWTPACPLAARPTLLPAPPLRSLQPQQHPPRIQ
jgi:hypothetical protein